MDKIKYYLNETIKIFKASPKWFKIFAGIMLVLGLFGGLGGFFSAILMVSLVGIVALLIRLAIVRYQVKNATPEELKSIQSKPLSGLTKSAMIALAVPFLVSVPMVSAFAPQPQKTETKSEVATIETKKEEPKQEVKEETPAVDESKAQDKDYKKGELKAVTKVVDGDTIYTAEYKIRIIGLDTPETVDPNTPVECFGAEASNKMKELVSGKNVYLVADPTQDSVDKYGRKLFHVYLEDGTNIAYTMINEGYANEYTYNSNPYKWQTQYRKAQSDAREAGRGLWSASTCSGNTDQPAQQSQTQQQQTQSSTPATTATPAPQAVAPAPVASSGSSAFPNCRAAWAAGAAPVYAGQPGYGSHLDGDGDGIGCEKRPKGM